jgi:hypothetical protein
VPNQHAPKRDRRALIEKNPHATGAALRRCQAASGVPDHRFSLGAGDTRKPLEEIVDASTILEVFEQGVNRHARPFEQPSAADFSRCAFDRWTLAPVKHGVLLFQIERLDKDANGLNSSETGVRPNNPCDTR